MPLNGIICKTLLCQFSCYGNIYYVLKYHTEDVCNLPYQYLNHSCKFHKQKLRTFNYFYAENVRSFSTGSLQSLPPPIPSSLINSFHRRLTLPHAPSIARSQQCGVLVRNHTLDRNHLLNLEAQMADPHSPIT